MNKRRVARLNSLLREVISEILREDLHHILGTGHLVTVTSVEITADLSFAKVFISVLGEQPLKEAYCESLNEHAKQIAHLAYKKVVMRSFPKLQFCLDEGLEKQMRISHLLEELDPPPAVLDNPEI